MCNCTENLLVINIAYYLIVMLAKRVEFTFFFVLCDFMKTFRCVVV